jgi:hypothetical protein
VAKRANPAPERVEVMKRLFVVLPISVLSVLALSAGGAGAAEPRNQACVGESLSTLATTMAPGTFGHSIAGFAQSPPVGSLTLPGIGDGIQALQAGQITDDTALNTCND